MVAARLLADYPVTDIRNRVTVRKARLSDIPWLANKMAEMDEIELRLTDDRLSPEIALRECLERSTYAWSAMRDGRTLAMFGVAVDDVASGIGTPWFLMSGEMYRSPRPLLRLGPSYVAMMQKNFRLLQGAVLDAHEPAKRFLGYLGFRLSEPFPAPSGAHFRVYSREEVN